MSRTLGVRKTGGRRWAGASALLAASGAIVLAGQFAGCGGAGGSSPKSPESANLYVKSFSVPNYSGIRLDEDLKLILSAPVNEDTINPDSFQMRTGAQGGTAPFGVYVRGEFMVDPATQNRVVVDPEALTENLIGRAERNGDLSGIADISKGRIDLGYSEPPGHNGNRRPLFDRSRRSVVTFVPEIPTRAALDDTGFTPGASYNVVVPGYPSTDTLENMNGAQLLSINNRVFTSSFKVLPATSPLLFIGAESAGIPRVVHSGPFNGTQGVPVTSTIAIRFDQPLDPRTVLPIAFKVERIDVAAPYPTIPVSVFLAQQRLGKVEVILTPINPMPANATIRVTLGAVIQNLLGDPLNPSVISFFTGTGHPIPDSDPLEDFVTQTRLDGALTTANWNATKPYVGAVAGQLTATFAPYSGDGTDGAYAPTIGLTTAISTGTLVQRVYNFTTVSIPIGARVVAQGAFPLVIHCQGSVDISGELRIEGFSGGNGYRGDDVSGPATGGAGGVGGPGGNPGGDGAFKTIGVGGNFDGLDGVGIPASSGGTGGNTGENDGGGSQTNNSPAGATGPFWPRLDYAGGPKQSPCTAAPKTFEPCRIRECGGGGGGSVTGGNGELFGATLIRRGGAGFPNGGLGGGLWGTATMSGANNAASVQVLDPANLPNGLRTISLNNIPTLTAGMGGAGGGGGGGEDDSQGDLVHWGAADGSDEGGGGGGGGGGALQIITYTTINVAGTISAKGGAGGSSYDDVAQTSFSQGAGGGGGSGGVIWLQCRGSMTIQGGAILDVSGGNGGQGFADGSTQVYNGGTGAAGRIRIEDSDGIVAGAPAASSSGVFAPTLDLVSTAYSLWQDTHIATPLFTAPIITADAFLSLPYNGTIKIYMEGAPQLVPAGPVPVPDTSKSTGMLRIWDTTGNPIVGNPFDTLTANYSQFWRFRVDFTVDASHTFTDPLPMVDKIQFKISQ
jgi:hypothetical protein